MEQRTIAGPGALGALIRERRHELSLTQTDVADVARTSLRFVSELEAGKRTAQLDAILRVMAALGLELTVGSR